MITKDKLEIYAGKLLFKMNDDEYEVLRGEFDIILKQMDLIGKIDGIEQIEPMTFPYVLERTYMREDNPVNLLSTDDLMKNSRENKNSQVIVPKVVE